MDRILSLFLIAVACHAMSQEEQNEIWRKAMEASANAPRRVPVQPGVVSLTPTVKAAPPVEEIRAEDWTVIGQARCRIIGLRIGKVDLEGGTSSVDDLLIADVEINNPSSTQLLNYRSWRTRWLELSPEKLANAIDEYGNTYPRVYFGFGKTPVGACDLNESIYPGKTIRDVLMFSRPVDAAKVITIQLPGEAIGSTDQLKLMFALPNR